MTRKQAIAFMSPYLSASTIEAFLAKQPKRLDRSVVEKFTQDLVITMGN